MENYAWPGNVRQLENICRWLTVMSSSRKILVQDLPNELLQQNEEQVSDLAHWQDKLKQNLTQQVKQGQNTALQEVQLEFEHLLIQLAMELTQGHKQEAAKLLGWGRNTITRKLKKHLD